MTLDELNVKKGFYRFFCDLGLRDTFQQRTAPKSIEINMEKLRMKFSALNVNFDGPTLDFLRAKAATVFSAS